MSSTTSVWGLFPEVNYIVDIERFIQSHYNSQFDYRFFFFWSGLFLLHTHYTLEHVQETCKFLLKHFYSLLRFFCPLRSLKI